MTSAHAYAIGGEIRVDFCGAPPVMPETGTMRRATVTALSRRKVRRMRAIRSDATRSRYSRERTRTRAGARALKLTPVSSTLY